MSFRFRSTYVDISLDHFRHNVRLLKSMRRGDEFFCPMIKADGYGHGDVALASVLEDEGVSAVGVALLEEAIKIRQSGFRSPLLFFGMFDASAVEAIEQYKITPVLSHWDQIEALKDALTQPLSVHLKFNTGMNRMGFDLNEASRLADFFTSEKKLKIQGICQHFFSGEDAALPQGHTQEQLTLFKTLFSYFPASLIWHAYNSSAWVISAEVEKQNARASEGAPLFGVRPGIALYGYPPKEYRNSLGVFKPVMSLYSKVALSRKIKRNELVSYGGTWKAERDSHIGVIEMGYADGYHRALSNKAQVYVGNEAVPVIGRVCMDYFLIDLTDLKNKKDDYKGTKILVFGQNAEVQQGADVLADQVGTISYEILTSISARVPRSYSGSGANSCFYK